MASDRVRAAVRALVIAAAGAGGAFAATRGLYATALLAALIAVWTAALDLVDTGRKPPPRPLPRRWSRTAPTLLARATRYWRPRWKMRPISRLR